MINVTNKVSGESVDLDTSTPDGIVQAWQYAQELDKMSKRLKDELKKAVPTLLVNDSVSDPIGKFMFRRSWTQRKTYDKATLRRFLDEDLLDDFMVIKKGNVDKYIKENHDQIPPDVLRAIKEAEIPDGDAYEVIKLEKVLE